MREEQFSDELIAMILKKMHDGISLDELSVTHDISLDTLYRWKVRFGGKEELLKRLQELEEENYRLKGKLADIKIQQSALDTGGNDHIYRILASNIPGTAFTILDKEERYLLAEGDFLQTMGYVKETMPGKKISEVITPENYHGYYQKVIQQVFAGETVLTERQTLSGYYTLMKAVPLKDGKDEIFAIMFVLIDITAIKEAQHSLSKMNVKLESKVLERTEQLNEANRQLESFSYSVSHDLQAPLRYISGYASMIKEEYSGRVQDQEFDKLADRVVTNALRMQHLIDDLLNFSRISRKDLSKAEIDVEQLVHEILNELTTHQVNRKFDIRISTLPPVVGDGSMMRQVWYNLLSNAVKYTSKRELSMIEVDFTLDDQYINYSIKDNGAGFNMEYASKLFEVFQRLHKTSEYEGTGVGLALVKNIVQRHGGKIWAESEVDQGSRFWFSLPRNKGV